MKLFADERRKKIYKHLLQYKRAEVSSLAKDLNVSVATLRSDLNEMEKQNLIIRTHGGAILNEDSQSDNRFAIRQFKNTDLKTAIAKKAFTLIENKQSILLDASSTSFELAKLLFESDLRLTIITTGLDTAIKLKDNPNFTVLILGGVITPLSTSLEGTLGLNMLDNLNIDWLFISAHGFSHKHGLEDFNIYEVALKKELIKHAQSVVALIDSTKLNKSSSASFANIDEIDYLIINKNHDSENILSKMDVNNLKIIFA